MMRVTLDLPISSILHDGGKVEETRSELDCSYGSAEWHAVSGICAMRSQRLTEKTLLSMPVPRVIQLLSSPLPQLRAMTDHLSHVTHQLLFQKYLKSVLLGPVFHVSRHVPVYSDVRPLLIPSSTTSLNAFRRAASVSFAPDWDTMAMLHTLATHSEVVSTWKHCFIRGSDLFDPEILDVCIGLVSSWTVERPTRLVVSEDGDTQLELKLEPEIVKFDCVTNLLSSLPSQLCVYRRRRSTCLAMIYPWSMSLFLHDGDKIIEV